MNYVRFAHESGHPEGGRGMSAYDPKRTSVGFPFEIGVAIKMLVKAKRWRAHDIKDAN